MDTGESLAAVGLFQPVHHTNLPLCCNTFRFKTNSPEMHYVLFIEGTPVALRTLNKLQCGESHAVFSRRPCSVLVTSHGTEIYYKYMNQQGWRSIPVFTNYP